MTSNPTLAISLHSIASLKPNPQNPRFHSKKQISQIAKSIETFGFNVPVLIDREHQVIAGHGRLAAAKVLGIQEVPAISLEHLTEAQAQAFLIADNRLTENADWDDKLLAESFKQLAELNLDFTLETTGFEMAEIDLLIEGNVVTSDTKADPADDIPPTSNDHVVTKPGDLWMLGRHRIFCGSALEASSYEAVLGREKAAMVFTDPPYNVPIDGYASGFGKVHHREFAMACGEMTEQEFTNFLSTAIALLATHSADGSIHFVCMDWHHMRELLTAARSAYELKNLCVWAKDNGGQGTFYRSQHELVFVFKNGKKPHRNNMQLGQHGRYRTNVWHYPSVNSFGRASDEGVLLKLHPTVKPTALVADAILDCSARGDIVLDPFLGSGTTVIAAERTGRAGYGIEIDPVYVDTAVRRWQGFTGEAAIHAISGEKFDSVKKDITHGR